MRSLADALYGLVLVRVDTVVAFARKTERSTYDTIVHIVNIVKVGYRRKFEEVLIADGNCTRDVIDVLFIGMSLDIFGQVYFPPFPVQIDDRPGMVQAVAVQGATGDAQLTAHDGEDVDEVTADTSVGVVHMPGSCIVVVTAHTSFLQDGGHIVVICQVLRHPVMDHDDFHAVRQGIVRHDVMGERTPEVSVAATVWTVDYRICDILFIHREALFRGHIVRLGKGTDVVGLCDAGADCLFGAGDGVDRIDHAVVDIQRHHDFGVIVEPDCQGEETIVLVREVEGIVGIIRSHFQVFPAFGLFGLDDSPDRGDVLVIVFIGSVGDGAVLCRDMEPVIELEGEHGAVQTCTSISVSPEAEQLVAGRFRDGVLGDYQGGDAGFDTVMVSVMGSLGLGRGRGLGRSLGRLCRRFCGGSNGRLLGFLQSFLLYLVVSNNVCTSAASCDCVCGLTAASEQPCDNHGEDEPCDET